MPEGGTLFRIAERLRPALAGQTVVSAQTASWASLDPDDFVGKRIEAVEAQGKHLLIRLDGDRTLHTHLGMPGAWHLYRRGQPWSKPPHQAAVVLRTADHEAVCFNPPVIELLSARRLEHDAWLNSLGPDMMRADADLDEATRRLRRHAEAPIGEAVMNQSIACGIGNVYKSESLFLVGLNPWKRVRDLSDEQVTGYWELVRKLMARNRGRGPRRTRFQVDGPRLWVYGRQGELCLKCGQRIAMRRQGSAGRSTYWCCQCQT